MKIIPTWTIPMFQFEWDQYATFKDQLIDLCYKLEAEGKTSNVATNIKNNLYESDFDLLARKETCIAELLEFSRKSVFNSATIANKGRWPAGARIGVEVHESWCHITRDGGYHDMHIHPNCSWSGIFYVKAGNSDLANRNGVNRFFAPYSSAYSDVGTKYISDFTSFDLAPNDGELIIFPSFIPHSAMPYYGAEDRIVIAFNCRLLNGTTIALDI